MPLAIFSKSTVFPALGGDTINPLCPFPMGTKRSMMRVEISRERFPKLTAHQEKWSEVLKKRAPFGLLWIFIIYSLNPQKGIVSFSFFGGRTCPAILSPTLNIKRLICEGET